MKPLVLALALLAAACASAAPTAAPIQLGVSHTLQSNVLDEAREINVWLPPGYSEGGDRYTVLYLIDGGVEQDFPHIAGLGQLGAVSYTYAPLIIVGVKTGTRIAELTPPPADQRFRAAFPNAGGSARFREFLHTEVIPFIDARYRTTESRAVIGESLAGLFVVDTFLNEPGLFSDYVAVSPSLWWDDRALARSSALLLRQQPGSSRRLYLSIADEGGTMRDGVDLFRAAVEAAPTRATLRFSDPSTGETHATTFHPAALDALRWLYATPPYDYGPTPRWMIEGGTPPAN